MDDAKLEWVKCEFSKAYVQQSRKMLIFPPMLILLGIFSFFTIPKFWAGLVVLCIGGIAGGLFLLVYYRCESQRVTEVAFTDDGLRFKRKTGKEDGFLWDEVVKIENADMGMKDVSILWLHASQGPALAECNRTTIARKKDGRVRSVDVGANLAGRIRKALAVEETVPSSE